MTVIEPQLGKEAAMFVTLAVILLDRKTQTAVTKFKFNP